MKINTDGSSQGNPGHSSIEAISKGNDGGAVFMLSIYKGQHSNNLMEALSIKIDVERGCSLGWKEIICEFESQIFVDMLNNRSLNNLFFDYEFQFNVYPKCNISIYFTKLTYKKK